MEKKTCKLCGEEFEPVKYWQVYCRKDCRMEAQKLRMRKARALLKQEEQRDTQS